MTVLGKDVGYPLGYELGYSASGAPAFRDILGSNLAFLWDVSRTDLISFASGEVDSITDAIGGVAISASGAGARPAYTANNANLAGKPTIDCAISGARILRNLTAGTLAASGTRPFVFLIGRNRTLASTTTEVALYTLRGTTHDLQARALGNGAGIDVWRSNYFNGANRISDSGDVQNTTGHLFGSHIDGSNSSLFLDGTLLAPNANGGTALGGTGFTIVYVGTNAGNQACDLSWSVFGMCIAAPTALELADLTREARRYYGTP